MQSNQSSSSSTRLLLTTLAVVGLASSSAVSTSPSANATSEATAFGTITSGGSKCVVGNPNTYITQNDLDWIWQNRIGPNAKPTESNNNVMSNKNWIIDHLVKNKGMLNYCIRWDSDTKLTKSVASKFEAMLNRQYKAWNQWLIGYNCWPYNDIKVKVTGFAVKDSSALDWNDDSLGKIYKGDLDGDGVPRCPQNCYRFYDNGAGAWSDTSSCQAQPWDIYLWPRAGLEGGLGDDSGLEVNMENMLASLDDKQLTIVAHEIGHGFGLPDFYGLADMPGGTKFPACLMKAGSSMTVTPSDGWMLRRVWSTPSPATTSNHCTSRILRGPPSSPRSYTFPNRCSCPCSTVTYCKMRAQLKPQVNVYLVHVIGALVDRPSCVASVRHAACFMNHMMS